MTKQVKNQSEFLQELSADSDMQERLKQALQGADQDQVNSLVEEHAAKAGFELEAIDDALIEELQQVIGEIQLSDEALDQVSGGCCPPYEQKPRLPPESHPGKGKNPPRKRKSGQS
ncbi:MAG: hypothetical protein ABR522_10290 [Marinobacter sp.]